MSKPLTFIQKIRVFRRYLREQKDGVMVDCGFCGSIDVSFNNQEINKPNNYPNHLVYFSDYTCNKCGATCENKQIWKKNS